MSEDRDRTPEEVAAMQVKIGKPIAECRSHEDYCRIGDCCCSVIAKLLFAAVALEQGLESEKAAQEPLVWAA